MIIAPPPLSLVEEIKQILSLVGDPKLCKENLDSFLKVLEMSKESQDKASKDLQEAALLNKILSEKSAEFEIEKSKFAEEQYKLSARKLDYDTKEKELAQAKKVFEIQLEAFENGKSGMQATLDKKNSDANSLMDKAQNLMNEALSMKSSYEEKLAGLKSLVGG